MGSVDNGCFYSRYCPKARGGGRIDVREISKSEFVRTVMKLSCRTKYPLVFIHGAGFRDLKWPVYWGRIPSVLEEQGAIIYYGLQDCWASIETNAQVIAGRIDEILAELGSEKVNIIAHSKGGLDARWRLLHLDMEVRLPALQR